MKTACAMLLACGLFGATVASAAEAKDTGVEGNLNVELTSSHVWRGEVINDETCFQPSVVFNKGNASLGLWGTWDLRHDPESSARTRADARLDYTIIKDVHIMTPGLIAYIYEDDYLARARDTFEIFWEYAVDMAYAADKRFIPALSINYDFVDVKGAYLALKLKHSYKLVKDKVDFDTCLNIGWADKRYLNAKFSMPKYAEEEDRTYTPDKSAFLDFTLTAGLPMVVNEQFTLTPAIKYMHLLDHDMRAGLRDAGEKVSNLGGSITVTYSF
jgi:hypothetical protein